MQNTGILQQASQFAEDGHFDRARELVLRAIKNDKLDVEAWWALAHVARTDKERDRAIREVLQLEPNHSHALLMRDQIRAGSVPSLNQSTRASNTKVTDVDFLPKALITLFAYFVFYLVGFALNVYFLYEANRFHQTHGFKPDNVGCLWAMLVLSVIVVVSAIMAVVGFFALVAFLPA